MKLYFTPIQYVNMTFPNNNNNYDYTFDLQTLTLSN